MGCLMALRCLVSCVWVCCENFWFDSHESLAGSVGFEARVILLVLIDNFLKCVQFWE
jgi:hypothetical protein